MEIIKPSVEVISDISEPAVREMMQKIEQAGRTCYKSEAKNPDNDPELTDAFVGRIIGRQHTSVIEHHSLTVRFICDRGVSHELVRHRLCSFSQESTRYVAVDKVGAQFVLPPWCPESMVGEYDIYWDGLQGCLDGHTEEKFAMGDLQWDDASLQWFWAMALAERDYRGLRKKGWKPEQARSVLPNSLKTEIVVTANLRQWREVFRQRTAKAAHPQIREIMEPLAKIFAEKMPVIFGDLV